MVQDIEPYRYSCEYTPKQPDERDCLIIMREGGILLEDVGGSPMLPRVGRQEALFPTEAPEFIYLFSVDDTAFFLSRQPAEENGAFRYHNVRSLRGLQPAWLAFAGATALHLASWYETHQYCGRCSTRFLHKEDERALHCPSCGALAYPGISPVVIVGVIDGDRLLLTKYAQAAYKNHALIAGFVEIGETLEDAVKREVLEEVGLNVKNIRYHKSQPWGFSQSVLMGFFAELDGSGDVSLDTRELSTAVWFSREDIPRDDTTFSLTWDMIETFRNGNGDR